MPASPSDGEGVTKLCLQTPPCSKPLTVGEDIQLKYEEKLEREDCGEDIGCGSSKGKETKVEVFGSSKGKEIEVEVYSSSKGKETHVDVYGSSKGKETEVEASGNEAEYFDPFEDLDDILGQYSNENKGKDQAQRKSILCDLKQSHVDVSKADLDVIDLDSFGSDLEDGIDTERRTILRELRKQIKSIDKGMFDFFVGQRYDNKELVKDRIRKHLVKSRRKLSITKNNNVRVRAICVGKMPTYSSFDGMDQPIITCLEYMREYLMKRIVIVREVGVDWYPCKHVVEAIWNAIENGLNASMPEDSVQQCYRLETWETVYS
ncbi:hypothetical protein Tco_1276182, partial [Tanacetum coccineum]